MENNHTVYGIPISQYCGNKSEAKCDEINNSVRQAETKFAYEVVPVVDEIAKFVITPYGAYDSYQNAKTPAEKLLALSELIPAGKLANKAKSLLSKAADLYQAGKLSEAKKYLQEAQSYMSQMVAEIKYNPFAMQTATPNGAKMPPTSASQGGKSVGNGSLPSPQQILTDGSHIQRGGKLLPNIRYKAGEFDYLYETDNLGRIKSFETDKLQLTQRDRLKHNSKTPDKVKGQDHAGHLIGDRFGGSPNLDNLVSQHKDVNLSEYKKLENIWANSIQSGKNVKIQINIEYAEGTKRPTRFVGYYWIDNDRIKIDINNL